MTRAPRLKTFLAILGIFCLLSLSLSELAWARAGGGRSSGSTGSRSVTRSAPTSRPTTPPPPPPSQPFQQTRPVTPPPQSSGFMRGLAGGLLGGFVGSMLFRGMAGAGGAGGYGHSSGPGLFDLILIGAVLYGLYYFLIKRRRNQGPGGPSSGLGGLFGGSSDTPPPPPPGGYAPPPPPGASYAPPPPPPSYGPDPAQELAAGLGYIRSMDPGFNEQAFKDQVMDAFFQIQAAYGRRDLASVQGLLTSEMHGILGADINQLKAQGQINHLENIAVRAVDLSQAWQEQGQDYLTVLFTANLLDYTVDDKSGQVLSGSNTQPVKFQELWTFTRPVGPGPWQLSAITQAN